MSDHNPTAPESQIELGGKSYSLSFKRRDFANAEWRLKMPLLGPEAKEVFWSRVGANPAYATDVLLFVGLQRVIVAQEKAQKEYEEACRAPKSSSNGNKPEAPPAPWSFGDVQDLITFENAEYVENRVLDAFRAAMPAEKPAEDQEQPPDGSPLAAPNGGSAPGPSAVTISG